MSKQYFFVVIKPYRQDFITNPRKEEDEIMSDHFNYLKSLLKQKKLFLAGPTLVTNDPYGIVIFETESEEEAKKLIKNDPSVKAGIQNVTDLRPIRLSLMRK